MSLSKKLQDAKLLLHQEQLQQLLRFAQYLRNWNQKVNLVSRKDVAFLEEHHILHSLLLLRIIRFPAGIRVIDVGTGGGFPGIPLAIAMPDVHFTLLDSKRKKIQVLHAIVQRLQLRNVRLIWQRSEEHREKYHFIVARAVAPLQKFLKQTRHLILSEKIAIQNFKPGIFYYKGEKDEDLKKLHHPYHLFYLREFYSHPYFSEKVIVYLPFYSQDK